MNMTDRVVRRAEVQAITGLSRSSIYEAMAIGDFPKPIRIGKRAVGWRLSAIMAWLDARRVA